LYIRHEEGIGEEGTLLRFNGVDFVPTDEQGQVNTGFRNVAEYIIIELPVKN